MGLYVEPKAAATELGAKDGSFSAGDRVDAVCTALADGNFGKALWLTTVRDITGAQFTNALSTKVEPRMQGSEEGLQALSTLVAAFDGVKLKKGTHVLLKFDPADNLEVGIDTSGTGGPFTDGDAKPKTTIKCALLGRCLLENFLGSASAVPEARQEWGRGGQLLLESEGGGRDAGTSGA